MKKLFILISLLLLTSSAWGVTKVLTHADLPYTCANDDILYIDTTNANPVTLEAHGTAIIIPYNVSHVRLNFGNDTLKFGIDNGNGVYGISIASGVTHGIEIIGGTIKHGGTTASSCVCVRAPYTKGLYIENTDMIIYGSDGHCFEAVQSPSGYNVEINGGDYWNNCDRYYSRCAYDGSAIIISNCGSSNDNNADFDYAAKIHGTIIHTTPGQGIVVSGRMTVDSAALVYIYDNDITCDVRNLNYLVNSGTCLSACNGYGILLRHVSRGSEIYNNSIHSGTTYGGGRGILIENCVGTNNSWLKIYNNIIDIHEGPNVEVGETGPVHGVRIRGIDGAEIDYVKFYNNSITVTGDYDLVTSSYTRFAHGLVISLTASLNHIIIENNTIIAKTLDDESNAIGLLFDAAPGDTAFKVRNNHIYSDSNIVGFGWANSGGKNITLIGDTLDIITPTYGPATWQVGYLSNAWDCSGIIARDIIYQGTASDTNIIFANAGTLDIKLQKTCSLFVIGSNDLFVKNAACSVWNNYDQYVFSGITNELGIVSGITSYWYESNTVSDSLVFNPFTIHVWDSTGTDFRFADSTITWNDGNFTMKLANTLGATPFQFVSIINTTRTTINFSVSFTNIDSAVIYSKLILDQLNPPVTKVDSVYSPANPVSLLANDLVAGTSYNFMLISADSAKIDTTDVGTISTLDLLNQINVFTDTTATSIDVQTNFSGIDGTILYYKLLCDTDNPPTTKIGDSIVSPTNPNTIQVTELIPNTVYYCRTIAVDAGGADTSIVSIITTLSSLSLSQSNVVVDTTRTSVKIETDFSGVSSAVSYYKLFLDMNNPPIAMKDSVYLPTDPDTTIVTGLNSGSTYYCRTIAEDVVGIDTSAVIVVVTDESLTQSNAVVDNQQTSVKIETNFSNIDSEVSWYKLLLDMNNPPTTKIGDSIVTPTDPDTIQATGLIADSKYYYCTVAKDGSETITSIVDSVITVSGSDTLLLTNIIATSVSATQERISWTTVRTSLYDTIQYGLTSNYGSKVGAAHFAQDSGWGTTYYENFDTNLSIIDDQTFGINDWLIAQLIDGATLTIANGYAYLNTDDFFDVGLIRSTNTLPTEYKIRTKVGLIHYDLANYELAVDTIDSRFNQHSGFLENGVYLITITNDTCVGTECAESWWHDTRKVVIDVDNHYNYVYPIDPENITLHPVFMVYMNAIKVGDHDMLRCWDDTGWNKAVWNWAVAYTYDTTLWYYAELEKFNDSMTLRLYDANKTILEETDPVHLDSILYMNDPIEYLYVGEPHSDDYEGNVRIDEISLLEPDIYTDHYLLIESLSPATEYHYSVISRNTSGVRSVSADSTFTSGGAGESVPIISLDSTVINFEVTRKAALPSDKNFVITNSGTGTLNWSISDNASWLDELPLSGNSNSKEIEISINTTNLPSNDYVDTITVSSTNATNSPQIIIVNYKVNAISDLKVMVR